MIFAYDSTESTVLEFSPLNFTSIKTLEEGFMPSQEKCADFFNYKTPIMLVWKTSLSFHWGGNNSNETIFF